MDASRDGCFLLICNTRWSYMASLSACSFWAGATDSTACTALLFPSPSLLPQQSRAQHMHKEEPVVVAAWEDRWTRHCLGHCARVGRISSLAGINNNHAAETMREHCDFASAMGANPWDAHLQTCLVSSLSRWDTINEQGRARTTLSWFGRWRSLSSRCGSSLRHVLYL